MAEEGGRHVRLAGVYNFNQGREIITEHYPLLLIEINDIIRAVDASQHKIKVSKEGTKEGRLLYSPSSLNNSFKAEFERRGWMRVRVPCDYQTSFYAEDYEVRTKLHRSFREIDFVKHNLGGEVQLGKYSFAAYDVCVKMPIFSQQGHIN